MKYKSDKFRTFKYFIFTTRQINVSDTVIVKHIQGDSSYQNNNNKQIHVAQEKKTHTKVHRFQFVLKKYVLKNFSLFLNVLIIHSNIPF